ncbi:MAG: UDP-N-acetyl-D-mannosamine dehydrogenase [Candidatus Methanophagaceae archaeon]|nr:MAG: UDP-N-acetyl-D-mannosamine dehydrogenase [Methanophagales archaeon]KAF5436469.1 UDPglucose 6-dehydrogenase/UDP-N-acetyl-D-galactosamine dehydrogenase [Methanophagales archaeon]
MKNKTVCVVGLGYVGLPLANAFSKHLKTIGFDIDRAKTQELNENNNANLICSSDPSSIKQADFVIIAVPTPVTKSKEPDLFYVKSAAEIVGKNLKNGAIVVLESTVYPGVTDEIIVPILELESGLKGGVDFKIGYSPERINPGDEAHTLNKITKIVAGMDEATTETLAELYGLITSVYKAKDIKTAEAAKVIENIQRDLNIALMNELTLIFHKVGLDTNSVLEAAGTKWNFQPYKPGLVGGHCIPVDPYYLVYKAKELGYHPQVILAGRAINDYMPKHIAEMAIKGLNEVGKVIKGSKVLILGLTYKENVPDTRESPVREMVEELKEFGVDVYGYDPLLSTEEIADFGVKALDFSFSTGFLFSKKKKCVKVDCVIAAVAHEEFMNMDLNAVKEMLNDNPVLIDVTGMFEEEGAKCEGFYYKRL